jgi:hypothetical protein
MNSLKEVAGRLKSLSGGINLSVEEKPNRIILKNNGFRIEAYGDTVLLFREKGTRSSCITHCHPDSWDEVYEAAVYYFQNPEELEKNQRKHYLLLGLIVIAGVLLAGWFF